MTTKHFRRMIVLSSGAAALCLFAAWSGTPTRASNRTAAGDQRDQNKQVALRFNRAISDHDLSELDAIVSPDVIDHNADPRSAPGLAGVKQGLQGLLAAFPDIQVTTTQLVAEGDLVADYSVGTGTNTGSLFGIPPTGGTVTSSNMDIFRIENGVITELWHLDDAAEQIMLQGGGAPGQ